MMTQQMPIARASQRGPWTQIDPEARAEILASASALAGLPYPALTATQYLAYRRNGSRAAFEQPYFARRQRLLRFTLAACAARDGRFLDDTLDGLWCICEESTWCVSAHSPDSSLMDVDSPVIDLFAAQTAALLSWVCYLLEDSLLPEAVQRVRREVYIRVLNPFQRRDDFWWMGIVRKDLNNWTPWILANTLQAARIWGEDIAARAQEILNRWLACIPPDGGVDEGVAYWNMAGGSLLDCLEMLDADRYSEPKIRRLAVFPLQMHIEDRWFVNFADCDAKPHLDAERVYTFGLRTENAELQALGTALAAGRESIFPGDTPEFYRTLCALFHPIPSPPEPMPQAQDYTLQSLQIWIRRRAHFYFACKGGHNGESHNHNDIGSFLLFIDGEPAIVDAGNMVYTAKTFQDETRYTLWNTRSANHNVPLIGAFEQAAGEGFAAAGACFSDTSARMDIAGAYPPQAGVRALLRTFELLPDGVSLRDDISLCNPQPVTWVFLLREAPSIGPDVVSAGSLRIAYPKGLAAAHTPWPVEDPRMARSFPGTLYRLTFVADASDAHTASFHLQRSPGSPA